MRLKSRQADPKVDPTRWLGHRVCPPALVEPLASANDLLTRGSVNPEETAVSQWRDSMVDRPETDGAAYLTGWTVSGVAVLGAIVAVWVLGI